MKAGLVILSVLALFGGIFYYLYPQKAETVVTYTQQKVRQQYSVAARLEQFGAAASERLTPYFKKAGLKFPPKAVALLAFKDSKQLELYASGAEGGWLKVRDYPIRAASGIAGPKLREGDKQVPEGMYAIEAFNPNSLYHVSLRLNYPNTFDREMGLADQRTDLGSDIMIHGKALSIGCLAMGDTVAEELFALAAWVGRENMQVIIAPTDFRQAAAETVDGQLPAWTTTLYQKIRAELAHYPLAKG